MGNRDHGEGKIATSRLLMRVSERCNIELKALTTRLRVGLLSVGYRKNSNAGRLLLLYPSLAHGDARDRYTVLGPRPRTSHLVTSLTERRLKMNEENLRC